MKQNRLFRKFMATFCCFVLLPFMLVLFFLLQSANRLQLENDIKQNDNIAAQTVNAIRQQSELAENMCKTVTQNQNLTSFLDKEYETTPDLLYYSTTIRDFVKVTNGVSDIKLRIYLSNDSIPMGFGIFFPMSYIESSDELCAFLNSQQEAVWLNGRFDQAVYAYQRTGRDDAWHYFLKIQTGSHLTGVIEATVPQSVYSVANTFSETVLEPVRLSGCYLYNYSGLPVSESTVENFPSGEPIFHDRELVYSKYELPNGPFDVIIVTRRSQTTAVNATLALLLPMLFVVMMVAFFAYTRRTFRDIHACLDGMETAIENNFVQPASSESLPLIQALQRNDEIGTLARRISYLLTQIQILLAQKIQQQTAAKEAALLALQHQINPHFLYNTMEVFSSRMELAGLYEESDAISAFCRMLRYSMNTKDLMTTLSDEICQVKYYLAIQHLRNIPFDVVFDIPDPLKKERSIRFLLQPFVENSFKYRGNADPLRIFISARKMDSRIELLIQNNGEPLSLQRLNELNERFENGDASMKTNGEHIGLNNINARLKLFYGDDHFIRAECDGEITAFRFCIECCSPHPDPPAAL